MVKNSNLLFVFSKCFLIIFIVKIIIKVLTLASHCEVFIR